MGIDQQPKDVGTARGRPKGATRKRRINPPVSALPLCKAKEVVAKMERVMGIDQQPKGVGTARGRPKGATRKRRINPLASNSTVSVAKTEACQFGAGDGNRTHV